MTVSRRTVLGAIVLAAVAAVIAGGLMIVGSPGEARLRRLDETRVSHLRQIQSAVNAYWLRQKALPESLAQASSLGMDVPAADPATGAAYEYRVTGERLFELCATFDRASDRGPSGGPDDPFWAHTSGRQCFKLEIKAVR